MRLLFAIVALLAASAFADDPAPAQKTGPAPGPKTDLKLEPKVLAGGAEAFSMLPSDYRMLVGQCMDRFQARDFVGTLVAADKADQIHPPTVWTINVRGAVAIERRKFDEGEAYCKKALELEPDFFPARFNLCEIPFLKGQYAEARAQWEALLSAYPVPTNSVVRDGTPELLAYRIFLCYLLERDFEHAKAWLERLPFPSDTAAYYYAHAAWEKMHGHEDKWKDWIRQAEFIWPAAKRSGFTDVLIQIGWIESDQPAATDATTAPSPGPK